MQATITCTQAGTLLPSAGATSPAMWTCPQRRGTRLMEYATVNKLMSGIGNRSFFSDTVLTRGMFVTVLGQLA